MQKIKYEIKFHITFAADILLNRKIYSRVKQKPYKILNQDIVIRNILISVTQEYFKV